MFLNISQKSNILQIQLTLCSSGSSEALCQQYDFSPLWKKLKSGTAA